MRYQKGYAGRVRHTEAMDDFTDALKELAPAVAGIVAAAIFVAAFAVPVVWFRAHQEAAAFNRFTTGPKATTWDAVWVELRVETER